MNGQWPWADTKKISVFKSDLVDRKERGILNLVTTSDEAVYRRGGALTLQHCFTYSTSEITDKPTWLDHMSWIICNVQRPTAPSCTLDLFYRGAQLCAVVECQHPPYNQERDVCHRTERFPRLHLDLGTKFKVYIRVNVPSVLCLPVLHRCFPSSVASFATSLVKWLFSPLVT